jgi:YfiH family protein
VSSPTPFLLHPFPEWRDRVAAAFTTRYLGGTGGGGPYDDLNLGFRSGDDPDRVAGNWKTVLAAAGVPGKTLVMPRMVHGDAMADADAEGVAASTGSPVSGGTAAPGTGPDGAPLQRLEPDGADAVCTRSTGKVLAVTMADCLTSLIFDPESGTAAAVHAGWRGTHAHILEKALRSLAAAGRIRPASTWVAFGPCLRPEVLELGPEVAEKLERAFVRERSGKFYFDMPASNRSQALSAGIPAGQIRDLGGCTLTEPERYFSYRRDGQASGRLAAFISLL